MPICSTTVSTGLRAWVNAMRDLKGLDWIVDEGPFIGEHDLILTDLASLEKAFQYAAAHKLPVALWGCTDQVPRSTPQLQLPVSVDRFLQFTRHCTSIVTRSESPQLFGLTRFAIGN
jgi:hypothetical protein